MAWPTNIYIYIYIFIYLYIYIDIDIDIDILILLNTKFTRVPSIANLGVLRNSVSLY